MNKQEKPWCVQHRDGWCCTKAQPRGKPRYRDNVKTLCDHYVICTSRFERRQPDCPECIERRKGK